MSSNGKKKKKKNWSQLYDSPNLLAVPGGELGNEGGRENCTAHIHQMANMAHVNPAAHQCLNKPAGSTAQYWRFCTGENRFVFKAK